MGAAVVSLPTVQVIAIHSLLCTTSLLIVQPLVPCRFSMQVKSQVVVASVKLEQQARPFRRGGRWKNPKETSTRISYIPLKEAVQGQNLTTIIATFKSIRNSDSAWYVNKLIPTLSGGTLEAFWREHVLNEEDLARKVDRYTHTSAMSLLNRFVHSLPSALRLPVEHNKLLLCIAEISATKLPWILSKP